MLLLYTIPIYFFCNLFEHFVHSLSHNRNIKFLYNSHHYHHTVEFPPSKLVNNDHVYRSAIYNEYLQICSIIWVFSYYILSIQLFYLFFIESFAYLYTCDILHTSYHKNNSMFERFEWFQKKKREHLLHHKITCYNFNLFDNTGDKLMNKYKC